MKKFIFLSLFTLLLAFSSSAYSAEGGWYMGGYIGPNLLNDSELGSLSEADIEDILGEDVPDGTTASLGIEYETGFTINLVGGYDFGNFRLEGEVSYQDSNLEKINVNLTVPGEGTEAASEKLNGDVTTIPVLLNGYYDFLKGNAFRPYITAGVGQARVDAQIQGSNENSTVFAYQIGVGFGYNMSENVALDLRYRYFATSDFELEGYDFENSSHSILFGVRYYF
jgi:opacity protein-like surface antigen